MSQVVYAEGGMGPQALVFEVVFPKGDTPNIMLEESQPGNKVRQRLRYFIVLVSQLKVACLRVIPR